MTTSQPRSQDHLPELGRSGNESTPPPPPLNRPPTCDLPRKAKRPALQLVPPPQFGRLGQSTRSPQTGEEGVSQAGSGCHLHGEVPAAAAALQDEPRGHLNPPPAPPSFDVVGSLWLPAPLAGFGPRAVSFLIDSVAPVVGLILLLSVAAATGGAAWRVSLAAAGGLVLLGFGIWNSGYLQGTTGRSLGRRVANTKLVRIETGQPVGFAGAVLRQVCHLLEFGVGFLRPLWDGKHQTLADKVVGTVVVRTGEPTNDRVDT